MHIDVITSCTNHLACMISNVIDEHLNTSHVTPFMVFRATFCLELRSAITTYYRSHLPPTIKLVAWTLYNINIFTWFKLTLTKKIYKIV